MIYVVLHYQYFSANEVGTRIELLTTNKEQAEAFYEKHKPTVEKVAKHWHLIEVEDGEEWPSL